MACIFGFELRNSYGRLLHNHNHIIAYLWQCCVVWPFVLCLPACHGKCTIAHNKRNTHTRTDQRAHIAMVHTRMNTPVASNFKFKCNNHFQVLFSFSFGWAIVSCLVCSLCANRFSKHEQIRTFMRWTCRIPFTFRSSFPTYFNNMHPECMNINP